MKFGQTKRALAAADKLRFAAVGYARALRMADLLSPADADANIVLNRADLFSAAVQYGQAYDRIKPARRA